MPSPPPFSPSRRRTLALLLALASAGAAGTTACARTGSGRSGSGAITLDFWAWADIGQAVDLWNSTHPDVHVELSAPAGGASIFQRLSSAVAAGSGAPDLVQVDYNNLTTLAVAGYLEDITARAAALEPAFVPSAWRQVLIDGRVWAVPQDIGPMAMYYRQDIFEAHGLTVPRTWDAFRDTAARLRAADDSRYLTAYPAGDTFWFASLAAARGAQWFTTEGESWHVDIDGAPSRETADFWTELLADDLVTTSQHWNPAWHAALQDGTLATWLGPAWGAGTLTSYPPTAPEGVWRVASLPSVAADRPSSGYWGGSSTAVLAGSEHVAAAVEFAAWLNTDPDAADLLVDPEHSALFPASLSGQARPAVSRPHEAIGGRPIDDVFRAAADHTHVMTWGPTMDQVRDDFTDAVAAALGDGRPLRDALATAQGTTVAALEQKGLSVTA
ncbi:ABC transporter substrate-binding protein [Streptomyces hainanensis]|uniref:Extracellular solute-binding protein n=1 Tax=Streptomyces hainanensis TaxID=402648 RepID=A0A4R4TRZ6_9ACTN|nr:extracellular solute-binding protein [Streptomyces hainanensis]TDC78784.1 extracellular solute-binding protein [Streptomyces hainanensis]